VLASAGWLGDIHKTQNVTFEEQAGLVPVTIEKREGGRIWCELSAPQDLQIGRSVDPREAAAALSLSVADISSSFHPPCAASVGLAFLIVELESLDALGRARININAIEQLHAKDLPGDILFYTRDVEGLDFRARMFAPLDGVPEDPATGSANCALAALLAQLDPADNAEFNWRIAQGVEMGRPSLLEARVQKLNGKVSATLIGGNSVMVSEGTITLD
jgi:trans-2,3-dihydro-3-hydroxyanthranilate isomerase